MASEVNHHVGYSRENECWFVRFYPYQTEQQANEAAAAFTRSAPAATDTGLVTYRIEAYESTRYENGVFQSDGPDYQVIEDPEGDYVTRSQAVELLAAERADKERLAALLHENGTPRFNAVCERAEKAEANNAAERAEKEKLEAAWLEAEGIISDLKADNERLRLNADTHQRQFSAANVRAKNMTQKFLRLEADNAALTARVNELEDKNFEAEAIISERDDRLALVDRIADLIGLPQDQELDQVAFEMWLSRRNEAIEAKLAAAEAENTRLRKELKAKLAAQDVRTNQLVDDYAKLVQETIDQKDQIENLEDKLAAAEKALESYKSIVKDVCESQRGTKWGKCDECIFDAIERAALGGKKP